METKYVNWDTDWNDCIVVQPKKSRMKWCPTCQETHDVACFFHFRGSWLGCMMSKLNRAKAIQKIKGTGGAKGL